MSEPSTEPGCVIVGGGHAADELALSLRANGYPHAVTIVTDEPYPPYNRPPLSKAFLDGEPPPSTLYFRDAAIYPREHIGLQLATRVMAVDRTAHTLTLGGGSKLAYRTLVLATGARPRKLAVAGADLPGLLSVRTIADSLVMRATVGSGTRVVLIGAGYIGLETAAMLKKLGAAVTVLEAMPRVLQRVTAPEVSAFYQRIHGEQGIDIRCSVNVEALTREGRVTTVHLAGGEALAAELVIVGIGVVPNAEIAAAAGLDCANGVRVDGDCRTADPAIFAVGDVALAPSRLYGREMRIESVQNAKDQARHVAGVLCGKPPTPEPLPWFWSDQFDVKLQIAGVSQGYDQVVLRGTPEHGRSFAAFYLKQGAVIAVDAINRPREFMVGKRLVAAKAVVPPSRIADESIAIADLAPR